MKHVFLGALANVILVATPGFAANIDILANDTASPRLTDGGSDANGDNRLRAYNTSTDIDGWIKFDMSFIPDAATITSLSLTLFSEGDFNVPYNSPNIQVFRSSYDGWVLGGTGFPGTLDEALTGVDSGPFPSARHAAYTFSLNAGAVDWSADLLDDTLSLVLHNDKEASRMYWFGSDPVSATGNANSSGDVTAYIPKLSVTYEVAAVPLPATLPLAGSAAFALFAIGRRRKKNTVA